MSLSTLFYRLPRLTALSIFVVLISGFFAILTLGRQEDPTLVERYGYILVTLPGADAERMEATVTEPIERRLRELPEIAELNSRSRANVAQISLELRDDLDETEVDNAWNLVQQKVALAETELPPGTSPPTIERVIVGATTMLVGLTWRGDGEPPLAVMARVASGLEDEFKNLGDTEETEVFGLPNEEVRVIVDPEALAATGLSSSQAAGLIAAADSKTPAGILRGESSNLGLEVEGEFDSISRIRAVPLLQRADGSTVRVGDVARVEKGIEAPVSTMAINNGERTIMVGAFIQTGKRVDQWAERARAMVTGYSESTPDDIAVEIIFDQSTYTESRLNGLATNLLYSAMIVFVVLFFAMGWRAALVVGTALPLTIALVLVLFRFFDHTLHQMSVTGLVISLGLLIDNAIVVVDEYDQERAGGRGVLDAIDHSLSKLFGPLLASTLTTALAFAPIALQPGATGEFIGMIGVSVIFAVVGSFLISMTVIPAMAGWLDRPRVPNQKKVWWRDGVTFSVVSDGYRWTIERVLRFPVLGLVIGILPVMVGFQLSATLPTQFFPQTERDQFQVELTLPALASIEEAEAAAQKATELISAYPQVEAVYFAVGEPGPRVYYNSFSNTRGVAGMASGFVQLRDAETSRIIVSDVQRTLRDAFPNARVLATPFEQGPPVDAPIAFFLIGDSLETLNRLGNQTRRILSEVPGVTFTQAQLELGAPVVTFEADEAATALSGEQLSGLASDIRSELDGVVAGSILEGIKEIPVRVIASDIRRSDLSDLRSKTIGGMGASVGALGELTLNPETAVIIRKDGERVNEIYGFIEPYALPDPIFANFQQALEDEGFTLPPGYELEIGGNAETSSNAVNNLLGLAIPLVLVMLGAVALVFNSFRMAILVLAVGGMSMGLAFGGVWMFNLPLGFNAILGSLGLLGIAINGSIIVLSLLKGSEAAMRDDVIAQRDIVVDATRHIVATTLTTMGGFVPIILTGDVFWLPLATAIAGGVAGSALLALYFVPAVFRIMTMKPVRKLLFGYRPAPMPAE